MIINDLSDRVRELLKSEIKAVTNVWITHRSGILQFCFPYTKTDSEQDLYIIDFREIKSPDDKKTDTSIDFDCSVDIGTFQVPTQWELTYFLLDRQYRFRPELAPFLKYDSFESFYNDARHRLGSNACATPIYANTDEVADTFVNVMKTKRNVRNTSLKLKWYTFAFNMTSYLIKVLVKLNDKYYFLGSDEQDRLRENLHKFIGVKTSKYGKRIPIVPAIRIEPDSAAQKRFWGRTATRH